MKQNNVTNLTRENYTDGALIARTRSCTVASSSSIFLTKSLHKTISEGYNFIRNSSFLLYIAWEIEQLKNKMYSLSLLQRTLHQRLLMLSTWPYSPQHFPSPWGDYRPHLVHVSLGPCESASPNAISISLAIICRATNMTNRQTDRPHNCL